MAPGVPGLRKQEPGSSRTTARASKEGLPSMAGRDGLKGGANAAWIGARLCSSVRARKSGPEPRDATVERREARVPVTRRAAPSKVPRTTKRLSGLRSLMRMREGK